MIAAVAMVLLGASDLAARIAEVLPSVQEEKWLRIPWRTNLASARQEAQRQGKPIFMWIMNGHPFGCT